VEARDLVVGDVLEGKAGEGLAITGLSSRQEKLLVYNLDVEGCHTCAVHQYGILVHNKGKAEPRIFQADHPFLFLIRENSTGTVLFMGRVSNPSPATAPTRP
jgi:serine protease inhibitor